MPFIKKTIFIQEPTKLFLVLMHFFNISQNEAQKIIDTKKVFQNGKVVTDKSAVVEGSIEVLHFEPLSKGLEPIFVAKDFALFDKPSGIMVHPRNRKSGYTLIDEVKAQFGKDANIVHRIDKETSGLVLAARTKESERALKALFEKRAIKKSYLALVRGDLNKEIVIDAPILRNKDFSKIKLKVFIDPRGKDAVTSVRPLKRFGKFTLVEATPLTGRQHQIRVHLFHVKHPIVGDPIYGVDTKTAIAYLDGELLPSQRQNITGAKRLMLHANMLEFSFKETTYKLFSSYPFIKECYETTL